MRWWCFNLVNRLENSTITTEMMKVRYCTHIINMTTVCKWNWHHKVGPKVCLFLYPCGILKMVLNEHFTCTDEDKACKWVLNAESNLKTCAFPFIMMLPPLKNWGMPLHFPEIRSGHIFSTAVVLCLFWGRRLLVGPRKFQLCRG